MERILEDIISQKLILLVDFILEKNPNANRAHIYRKIHQLKFYVEKKNKKENLKAILSRKPTIQVRKSQFSNYILTLNEEEGINNYNDLNENKFVMNTGSKMVIGTENSEGEIEPLNKFLIEICHKYKLKYELPLNLNMSDEPDQDIVITNEIEGLGLNYAESDDDDKEEDD